MKVAQQDRRELWVFYSIVVVLFSLPIFAIFVDFFSPPFGGYADQRFLLCGALIGLLILSFLILARSSDAFFGLLRSWPLLLFSSAFILLSVPFAGQEFIWVEPGLYALYFLVVALVGTLIAEKPYKNNLVFSFILVVSLLCFLYGAMTVNVYLFAINDHVQSLTDFIPWGFVNIRYWSHVATWVLPLVPAASIFLSLKKLHLWSALITIGAGLWWWVVILSMARGTMVALTFGAICAFIIFGRRALPWFRSLLQHILVGAVLWFSLSVLVPFLFYDLSEGALRSLKLHGSGRIPLLVEAWQMSLENLPFGMGPQSWLTHNPLTEAYQTMPRLGHPHNMYLMWAAEYGWLLILCLLGVALKVFRQLLVVSRQPVLETENLCLVVALVVSVCAALAHAAVSAVFIAPASMLVGLPVLVLFWATLKPFQMSRGPGFGCSTESASRVRFFFALVLFGSVLMALLWIKDVARYYEAMRDDEVYYQDHSLGGLAPRFWFHGNFPRGAELMPPK